MPVSPDLMPETYINKNITKITKPCLGSHLPSSGLQFISHMSPYIDKYPYINLQHNACTINIHT